MTKPAIMVRPAVEADMAFVYATWLKSYRHSSRFAQDLTDDVYFAGHRAVVKAALDRPGTQIRVAVNPDDESQIYGYAVVEQDSSRTVVHFVFVKTVFRRLGVARAVLPPVESPTLVSHLTFSGKRLLPKAWLYNPYLA